MKATKSGRAQMTGKPVANASEEPAGQEEGTEGTEGTEEETGQEAGEAEGTEGTAEGTEEAEESEGAEAPEARGGWVSRALRGLQDRTALREEIRGLQNDLEGARAENDALRAEVTELRAVAEEVRRLEELVESQQEAEQTLNKRVRAEMTSVGIPEAEAPAATTEAALAGESLQEMQARMEQEPDPQKRRTIWKEMKARKEKKRGAA